MRKVYEELYTLGITISGRNFIIILLYTWAFSLKQKKISKTLMIQGCGTHNVDLTIIPTHVLYNLQSIMR